MWSKIAGGYIRRIRGGILFFGILFFCFGTVLFLYRAAVPMEAVGYAALLSAVFGGLILAWDFRRYARACHETGRQCSLAEPALEMLPPPMDLLEEDYQRLAGGLQEMYRRLESERESEYRERTDYFTIWIHQIKTPISAMHLLLQNQKMENGDAMAAELFKVEQYTDMVLQYLRLGSPVNDFVLDTYDLDQMIRQALRRYARVVIQSRLTLNFQETHRQVVTDEKWMVFVIGQILSNAVKYTEKGSIAIYAPDDESLVIEDTGIGIAAEDLPRIFEKGYTGFNGRMDKKATGLGLYLCRRICEKLNHTITAESKPGSGTRIILRF